MIKNQYNKYNDIEDFFKNIRDNIEKKIVSTITDKEIIEILNGGKRLRSLLSALSFKVCTKGNETDEQFQRSLEGTVSIELAHGASLVHDDIIDKDPLRRGKKSFYIKEGIGKAILTGHKMLVKGFDIALKHGKDVAKLYIDSWNEVVNGEIDEVYFNSKKNIKNGFSTKSQIFDKYNKIIDLKTAALFASSCKAGALEANMSGDILKVFADFGREIGLAYQLADDLVDLVNGEMIDSVIIPLLNKIENKTIKVGSFKKWVIKRKFAKNKNKIMDIYIEEIRKHINKAVQLSKSNLIPKSNFKDMLMDVPNYIINKMLHEINITI
jgi:geranylgeranyl pyrophosphate synthase